MGRDFSLLVNGDESPEDRTDNTEKWLCLSELRLRFVRCPEMRPLFFIRNRELGITFFVRVVVTLRLNL